MGKHWVSSTFRISSFGLENQTAYYADEPLVVIGYDGASYKEQVDSQSKKKADSRSEGQEDSNDKKEENLEDKKASRHRYPVITLVLYYGSTHWNANKTLRETLDFPDWGDYPDGSKEDFVEFFHDYGNNLIEVAFLTEEQIHLFQSDFRVVADMMVHRRKDPDYRPQPWELKHVEATLILLSTMTGDRRYEQVLNAEWEGGRPNTMDPYLDRIEEKGIERGDDLCATLMQKLYIEKREEDARRAAFDKSFRQELYKEFDLTLNRI